MITKTDQNDLDQDDIGDACDIDQDGDGFDNSFDNCPLISNSRQEDTDGDPLGDLCDDDDMDGDGILSVLDNCIMVPNTEQNDFDSDLIGDACDSDVDNDSVMNDNDKCAFTELGLVVSPKNGCSLSQLSPCEGPKRADKPWKNHGRYVSSVRRSARKFRKMGLISGYEKRIIVTDAAHSSCGK